VKKGGQLEESGPKEGDEFREKKNPERRKKVGTADSRPTAFAKGGWVSRRGTKETRAAKGPGGTLEN